MLNMNRASVSARRLSAEEELNDLRSTIAKQAEHLKTLEARLAAGGDTQDPSEAACAEILELLATAKDGKPGSLTVAQLIERCKGEATKSKIHHHIKKLEKRGKVWKREENDPRSGRPCTMVYHWSLVKLLA